MDYIPLNEVAKFINGRAFKPSEWEDKGLPIIRIQNLTRTSDAFNYFSGNFDERYRVKDGDILISWSASLGVYIWQGEDAILNQHIFRVETNGKVDKTYFFYAAQSVLDEMKAEVHGATMQHITKDRFEALKIPLPPIEEQQRIAGILARADRLWQLRRYALQLSEGYLQSVFLQMFGDPVTNPMGWEIRPLRNIARVSRGKFTPRPRNDPKYYGGEYPFIQTGDISRSNGYLRTWSQTLNHKGTRVSKAFDIGTVLVAIVGATIGETAILSFKSYCPDSVIGIEINSGESQPEFIEHLLRFWKPIFHARAPETARANINLDTLRPLPVIYPPFEQQVQFASIVRQVDRLRAQQHEAARQAEHLFATLLHRAFRGKL